MSLKQLIQKCREKNAKAQSELYHLFSGKLFSICLKYSRSYTEAEDNLQDAFVTIFNKIGQYKEKGSFEGWLKRITINTALQKYRTDKGVLNLVNEEVAIEDDVFVDSDSIPIDYLLKIIQELPDRYRLVFNLYVLDDFSHQDIADLLEISVGTSKSNLSRAKQLLKEQIESYKIQPKSNLL